MLTSSKMYTANNSKFTVLISRKMNPTLTECPLIPNNCKLKMMILINILVFCCQNICPGHHIYMHAICSKARYILGFLTENITVLILINSISFSNGVRLLSLGTLHEIEGIEKFACKTTT